MYLTADLRQRHFELYNVTEAARSIDAPVREFYRAVHAGRLPRPQKRLENSVRRYYSLDELESLERAWHEMKNHP